MSKLIVANWKMNGSLNKINNDLRIYLSNSNSNQANVVFAFPAVYIAHARNIIESESAKCKLASQDLSMHSGNGACTGEISGNMLLDCGISYSIIGHSERRMSGDTNEILIQKLNAAFGLGIIPIYCIGESIELRESQQYLSFLHKQLESLAKVADIKGLVIAYEPIWAIGTSLIPTMGQIKEVILYIKNYVSDNFPQISATVLYGGSVNAANVRDILNVPAVDGVLVGGASLKVDEFSAICNEA